MQQKITPFQMANLTLFSQIISKKFSKLENEGEPNTRGNFLKYLKCL
jgi:hypothetical protein